MPNRNGTGPLGQGPAGGPGRGFCREQGSTELLPRLGRGRRAGRGQGICCRSSHEVERLREEASRLEKDLSGLKRRVEETSEE